MNILIVQVGTPVNKNNFNLEELIEQPTLLHGNQYFQYYEVVNNLQTRSSIVAQGHHVEYVYFTERKHPIKVLKSALQIRRLVKQKNIDIVNVYWGGLSGLAASIFCPCKFVVSFLGSDIYGSYSPTGKKTLFGKVLAFCSQLTGLFSNGIIVMSNKMKEKIWTANRKKVVAIPEGFDPQKFNPIDKYESRKILNWNSNPTIIFFSSAEGIYVKNLPLAKAAFEIVKKSIPNAALKLIHGVKHSDLIHYYNAADVLLLTSYHEGSNNSIKEALACNCPVVTVNVGDGMERLENIAPSAVVNNFNAAELADKLVHVIKQDKRCNGAKIVQEVSLSSSAKKIVEFYKKVLA